jgi:aminoglycoside phosphotransferase family enzyme/predicted kinase
VTPRAVRLHNGRMEPAAARSGTDDALARHARLVDALCRVLAEPGAAPLRLETHISSVIVTPRHAYKLKKPVSLGFVDFSDPRVRRDACAEEVRLNRRLAPALYLGVVPIEGTMDAPRLGAPMLLAEGATPDAATPQAATLSAGTPRAPSPDAGDAEPPAEHAVWMRSFAQSALWERRVPAGEVDAAEATALGASIGAFHRDRAAPRPGSPHGSAQAVGARMRDNFEALRAPAMGADACTLRVLDTLAREADARLARLAPTLDARNRDGFVRDVHGDLHLGNIVTIDGVAVPFDCLEFDAALRTSDVADEIAFAMMDLRHAGRADLAWAFLDGWLEATGDFDAVPLLDHYRAYRAMVRAKVAAIRARQSAPDASPTGPGSACEGYLRLAGDFGARAAPPVMVAMHGLSGSGKSVLSAVLAGAIGAVRVRSDVERKRLLGMAAADRSGAHGALYASAARDAVYDRLAGLARRLLAAGQPVVVDASFLSRVQRERFRDLAHGAGAVFAIADLQAPEAVLRARLAARAARGTDPSDADEAVLDAQLRSQDRLDDAERAVAFVHRADDPLEPAAVGAAWRAFAAGAADARGRDAGA